MNAPPGLLRLAIIASAYLFSGANLFAQTGTSSLEAQLPGLTLSYGNGKTLNVGLDTYPDRQQFRSVSVFAGQTLQLNLQFPAATAGQSFFVGVVEDTGGLITTASKSASVTIGKDGGASFSYQAPLTSGHYHIAFRFGSREALFPLSVIDSSQAWRPSNGPRTN